MSSGRAAALGAVAAYGVVTLTVSYAFWGPYDGVRHDPAWADTVAFFAGLVAFHVAAGVVAGRWWALALPLGWALLSVPAGGYDTPVAIQIAFQTPFFWAPALAFGVAIRKGAGRLSRGDGVRRRQRTDPA